MKIRSALVAAALVLGAVGAAQAQFRNPADAVNYRQGAFAVMGHHFGMVGAMANGRVPFDAAAMQQNMGIIMTVAGLPWAGFTTDTQGLTSRARPSVWTERARFDAAAQNTARALIALDAASRTNDLAAIRRAFGETSQSCMACHDNFRN